MPMHRSYRGKIAYLHDDAGETGREWFDVIVHADGSRIVRARCEMDDDRLLRDVTISMDASFAPHHAYVHLMQNDQFMGSGWFRFSAEAAECQALTAREGRIDQRVPLTRPVRFFGTHPIVCDGMMPGLYDHASGERQQQVTAAASSLAPNGASGPMLAWFDMSIEYVGDEEIAVPAGLFATRRYRVYLPGAFDEPLNIWTTGSDCLVIKESWAVLKSRYELVELDRGPSWTK